MKVGTRELKNRLSHYLRHVRQGGEPIYVTDHGEVVAELRPAATGRSKASSDRQVLLDLAAKGDVALGEGPLKAFRPERPKRGRPLSKQLLEDRR